MAASRPAVSQDRAERGPVGLVSAATGKMRRDACANEPNPPRVTPLEPESDDVPDENGLMNRR